MTLKIVCGLFFASIVSVRCLQNQYCQLSCDYVVKTFTHTVCDREREKCGPHQQCGPDFKVVELSDRQRAYIVDLHNYLRNKVALGNETNGDQPPAANMNALSYNKELEYIAQCWANTCNGNPLIHDVCRRTDQFEHVGQNLGFINSSSPSINVQKAVKELIMLWYDEVELFQNDWLNDTQDRGPDFKVGHYTQMMWADTSEIGCAVTFYTSPEYNATWNHILLVCNYGPGGNYLGLPVYEVGEPCSRCSNGFKPSEQYDGLCKRTKHTTTDYENIFEIS